MSVTIPNEPIIIKSKIMCAPNKPAVTIPNTTTTDDHKISPPKLPLQGGDTAGNNHLYGDLISVPTSFKHSPKAKKLMPTFSEIVRETKSLLTLALPIAITTLIFYSRSMVSMLFLGRLGNIELAAGSLALAFANITGYSVLTGLSLGMEPLCSQAFGAQQPKLLSLTLQRAVLFLLLCSVPIATFWVNISNIFGYLHQDPSITRLARTYLIFSLPDLISNSFIFPIRIYLRAQGITHPLALASLVGMVFHLPINFLFVHRLHLSLAGVAAASAMSNLIILVTLVGYIWVRGLHTPTWTKPSNKCLTGWAPLIRLAVPSCVSLCLEWWWFEIMIVMCGLLENPKATVASMGVLIQTTSLLFTFPSSLGLAVSTRVGNELGANRPDKARVSAIVSMFLSGLMGLSSMTFAMSVKNLWAKMYTDDLDIIRLTSAALPILGLCELGNCPQTVGSGVVRGTARPSISSNVNLGAYYLVGMPVAVGLGFKLGFGFCGLWIGLLFAQLCCGGLTMYIVGTTNWEYEGTRAQLLTFGGRGSEMLPNDCDKNEREPLKLCVKVMSP